MVTEHGTAEEQAQIDLYLGRAYVEDGEYDKAMQIYADALQLAKEHQPIMWQGIFVPIWQICMVLEI